MFFLSSFFHQYYPQIMTMILGATPVGELNLAMPMALNYYHLPIWQAYLFSVIGNSIPPILVVYFLSDLVEFLYKKSDFFKRFFKWLFERTRHKFNHHYDKYGMFALIVFVATPLPLAGAWTAALAAWLFEFPKLQALCYIFLGIVASGVVILLFNMGVVKFLI
jgi:uncharacterized membrane protein